MTFVWLANLEAGEADRGEHVVDIEITHSCVDDKDKRRQENIHADLAHDRVVRDGAE